jgi:hypothetical protein
MLGVIRYLLFIRLLSEQVTVLSTYHSANLFETKATVTLRHPEEVMIKMITVTEDEKSW